MSFNNILLEKKDQLAIVTINRPDKLNALNKATIAELHDCFKGLRDDQEVRAIILTGSGEKSFVAGADISEFANFSPEQGEELSAKGNDTLFNYIETFPKPVIAAVNGFALGGGLELALASHIRIMSDNAKVGLPEVTLGVIPGYGGTQRLARMVGQGKAMEMILSAAMISADEALQWQLANQVVPQADLLATAEKLAGKIARNSSSALTAAINSINAIYEAGVDGKKVETQEFGKCFGTPDFVEGTTAFLEKRKPKF